MASVIRVLSEEVANRIAAGEVVERPASVVKELVENALDAGAQRLELDLEDGGTRLIRLTDDGAGMGRDDLARCILPHATSKIADVDDLFRIASFGFRGEALPSIASVSRTTITSRPAGEELGHRLSCDEGEAREPQPAGAPVGTTVEVRSLFWNVPARKKFLRQERTELSQCLDTVTRLLLPEPEVALRVTHNGRKVLEAPADKSLRQRIGRFLGDETAAKLLEARETKDGVTVEAYLGPVDLVRGNRRHQLFFLNGRFIKDRGLGAAIMQAYRGLIMPRDHPVALVFLEMDPAEVDVNVHPTKTEVRFRHRDRVFAAVHGLARRRLLSEAPDRDFAFRGAAAAAEAVADGDAAQATEPAATPESRSGRRPAAPLSRQEQLANLERELFPEGAPAAAKVPAPSPATGEGPVFPERARRAGHHRAPSLDEAVAGGGDEEFLQIHRSYLVEAAPGGLRIIDQHALHERKLYEELLVRFRSAEGEVQRLLVPEVLELGAADQALVLGFAEELETLGIEVEAFGGTSLCVRSLPLVLARAGAQEVISDVLEILRDEQGSLGREELIVETLANVACKAAVKFNDHLPRDEVAALLEWFREHPQYRNCPHGRPTSILISARDLENQFQRKK